MDPKRTKREGGVALLVSMLMMILMGLIGLASLDTVMRSRQVTGFQNMAETALYAADAGVAEGLDILRTDEFDGPVTAGDCIDSKIPNTGLGGGRSYQADPDSDQICMLATAGACPGRDNSIEVGANQTLLTVWNMRVEGNAPGGATAGVQATAQRCLSFGQ